MPTRRQILQAVSLAVVGGAARAAVLPSSRETLKFVFSRPENNPRTQWLIHVYRDICARMDKGFLFVDVPPNRATALVLAGEVDGELGRTYEYQREYPMLVRVAEPNNRVNFSAYAARRDVVFDNWTAVRRRGYRCEFRLGIKELEAMLADYVTEGNRSSVRSVFQGLERLQLGRTDLYFDVEEAVSDFFFIGDEAARLAPQPRIREAAVVQSTTGHAYLHPSRADLAPTLSAILKQMKQNGMVERYLTEALQQYKLSRQEGASP